MRLQDFQLLSCFHTFGHDLHMKILSHTDHSGNNVGTFLIRCQIARERLIDLQSVDRKAFQMGQARIARAKII